MRFPRVQFASASLRLRSLWLRSARLRFGGNFGGNFQGGISVHRFTMRFYSRFSKPAEVFEEQLPGGFPSILVSGRFG